LRQQFTNLSASILGVFLMLFALANSLVTMANGRYGTVLITALTSATLGLCCLAIPMVRGPWMWRIAAIVLASPYLFVIADFIDRAPSALVGR